MSESSTHMAIADRVYESEKRNAKALGHDGLDMAMLAFGAFCEVWSLSLSQDRLAVLTRFRPMGT
jgi:hypothetical protein